MLKTGRRREASGLCQMSNLTISQFTVFKISFFLIYRFRNSWFRIFRFRNFLFPTLPFSQITVSRFTVSQFTVFLFSAIRQRFVRDAFCIRSEAYGRAGSPRAYNVLPPTALRLPRDKLQCASRPSIPYWASKHGMINDERLKGIIYNSLNSSIRRKITAW